jgi:hypothetical protein
VIAVLALAAGGAVLAGAVVAVSSRDSRTATVGLLAALLGIVFVADPLPALPALALRLVAGVLAGYVLWVVVRERPVPTAGSALAWPTEAVLAAAGALVGWASHGLGAPGRGPEVASAVGVGLVVLAAGPVALGGRDALRVGIGLTLLLAGGTSLRVGLAGTPGPAEQIVLAGLTAGLGVAVALLVRGAATARGVEGARGLEGALGPETGRGGAAVRSGDPLEPGGNEAAP